MQTILQVNNLEVSYQHYQVLKDVTLDVQQGDYIGIVGPNGSGKTTLIKALLGLVAAKQGSIGLFGEPLNRFKAWHRIGYLPQFTPMTRKGFPAKVKEIIATGLLAKPRSSRPINAGSTINYVMDLFNIQGVRNKKIGELSGGQKQRVFLARAMVNQPDCLILDEPSVALDPESRLQFYQTLKEINQTEGVTILLVTHDSGTIGEYAEKLLYLDRQVIFYGTFKEFCQADSMTAYFGDFAQHLICHQHKGNCHD